jgi:hypothetical protein
MNFVLCNHLQSLACQSLPAGYREFVPLANAVPGILKRVEGALVLLPANYFHIFHGQSLQELDQIFRIFLGGKALIQNKKLSAPL